MVVKIISREEWGAREPTTRRYLPIPVTNVALQHWTPITFNKKQFWEPCTTMEECMKRCRAIQDLDLDGPDYHSDIHFSFLIGSDLNIYEGRGWTSLLTDSSYWDGIRIGLIGRWNQENPAPLDMLAVANDLIEYGKKRQYIKPDAYVFDMAKQIFEFEEDNDLD